MAVLKSTLKLTLLDQVTGRAKKIGGALRGLQRQQTAMLAPMRGVTGRLLAFGATYLGVTKGIDATVGSALKFESAFADVRKVIDGTDGQMGKIRKSIIDMSKVLPTSATGIAAIYAAAGQANIPMNELNKFAEMTAKVAVAWDTTEGDTGQSLAEIKNQLGLTVGEVGLFADALNHLSNKSAASAPRLLDFSKRIAANGEMFGFSSEQSLAFGGAMIASGSQAEVAATSFRNMGRALTKGERATKAQRVAFKKLGFDSVKVAKDMQKNALKTTLGVIDKIQGLPEWQQISIASALFGDEARGLMPVISNTTELRRQLGLVGDEANYAGSAFQEYLVRANTTGNVLKILGNKFSAYFQSIGDGMLPGIKEAALGINGIMDTLSERVSVFDNISAAIKGFADGFGYDGGIRTMVEDLGDFFFGAREGEAASDHLTGIFHKFREWGASVREFTAAFKENPIGEFLISLGGYGMILAGSAIGIAVFAGAIRKLGTALFFLSGAKAAVGILKTLLKIGGAFGVGATAGGVGGGKKPSVKSLPGGKNLSWLGLGAIGAGLFSQFETFKEFFSDLSAPFAEESEKTRQRGSINSTTKKIDAQRALEGKEPRRDIFQEWLSNRKTYQSSGHSLRPSQPASAFSTEAILSTLRSPPQQDVRVVNKEPPNVTVHAPITIHGVTDPVAAGNAAAAGLGEKTKAAIESSYSD